MHGVKYAFNHNLRGQFRNSVIVSLHVPKLNRLVYEDVVLDRGSVNDIVGRLTQIFKTDSRSTVSQRFSYNI